MAADNPKLFISYSWTSPDHERWVLNLANELCENSVDVILDKWDLKEGHDSNAFMEKMVTDPEIKKVALICDRMYAEKADGRSGGVGTETQIISGEVYAKQDQNKFVAVVVERAPDGKAFLPTYYTSRIYIDLSDQDLYATNFEQLLRWIYDKPLYVKPDLGKKPSFLDDQPAINLGTTTCFRRALDALRNNKEYAAGALTQYFDVFVQNLEQFRISEKQGEFDDHVIENIERFIPYRNEALEIFLALAQFRDTQETYRQLHRFFEGLIAYLYRPPNVSSYRDWDFDNFKFIVHELFLSAAASLLKYERFPALAYLLRHHYYVEKSEAPSKMVPFGDIREHMKSLEYRNTRLKLRRLSLRADLLHQRWGSTGIRFSYLMQADFILFLRDCLDVLREDRYQAWWPETLLYIERHGGAFEVFGRAQSLEYFDQIKCIFDVDSKADLEPLLQAFQDQRLRIPKWEWTTFEPGVLMGFQNIATKP
jgi:hypothetical protein